MKITLTGDHFRRLVAGKPITVEAKLDAMAARYGEAQVEILLEDIGFGVMRTSIDQAARDQEERDLAARTDKQP